MLNLSILLEDSARNYPERAAVVLGEQRLTYAQVNAAANQVANMLVARGIQPGDKVALSAELWSNVNFAPHGTIRQWSADASLAVLPTKRIQLDAGANFGLSRATPDLELYAGASILF